MSYPEVNFIHLETEQSQNFSFSPGLFCCSSGKSHSIFSITAIEFSNPFTHFISLEYTKAMHYSPIYRTSDIFLDFKSPPSLEPLTNRAGYDFDMVSTKFNIPILTKHPGNLVTEHVVAQCQNSYKI